MERNKDEEVIFTITKFGDIGDNQFYTRTDINTDYIQAIAEDLANVIWKNRKLGQAFIAAWENLRK